jgi:hypothetical protein
MAFANVAGSEGFEVTANTKGAEEGLEALEERMNRLAEAAVQANNKLAASRAELKAVADQLATIEQARKTVSPEVFERYLAGTKPEERIDLPALKARNDELQREVLLRGEAAAAAREQLRDARKAAEVPGVAPIGREQEGILKRLERLSAGREAGIPGILGMAGRGGLVGLGVLAGFQAISRLEQMLKVTGQEAFTTEGKIRNLGSALMSADIIGGIEALTAAPKSLEEVGVTADYALNHYEAFTKVAKGNAAAIKEQAQALDRQRISLSASGASTDEVREATDKANAKWDEYNKVADETRHVNADLAQEAKNLADSILMAREAAHYLQEELNRVGTGFRTATGEAVAFKGAVDSLTTREGMRVTPGVGLAQSQALAAASAANRATGVYVTRDQRIQAEITLAQAEGNLPKVLTLQKEAERRAWKAYETAKKSTATTEEAAKRPQLLQDYRQAQAARIGTEKQIGAEEDAAAAERKRLRQERLDKQAREYREALDTREQNLRNAYQAALQTPGTEDDRRRYRDLLGFLVGEGRDPRLTRGERADYRGDVVTLRGERAQDIKQAEDAADKAAQERSKTTEQRLKNRVAAAELTKKNIKDDLKALRDLRDYYRRAAEDKAGIWSEYEEAQFAYQRVETQKKIQALLGKPTPEERARTAASLLAETNRILREFSGNVMAGNVPGTAPATVVVNQHFRAPTADRAREARMAAINARQAFLG